MPTKTSTRKLSADEYRAILGDDVAKEVKIEVPLHYLNGALSRLQKKCETLVKNSEIEGSWRLKFTKANHSYYSYNHTPAKLEVVGGRPYTDDEIVKNGARLVAAKAKAEAREERDRAKNIAKYNALAEKLGVDPIKED